MARPLRDYEAKFMGVATNLAKLGFEITPEGDAIGYKTFNGQYKAPSKWKIAPNSVIDEDVDTDTYQDCSNGINVGSPRWLAREGMEKKNLWKILIKKEWFPGVVIPLGGYGKIRCEKVMIVDGYYNIHAVYDGNNGGYIYTARPVSPMTHPLVKSVPAARPILVVKPKPKMLKIVKKAAKASVVKKPAKKVTNTKVVKAARTVTKSAKKPVKKAAKKN